MKVKWALAAVLLMLFTSPAGGQGKTGKLPGAFLLQKSFEFKPVPEGTKVLHEYVLKNTGAATLEIKDVRTG